MNLLESAGFSKSNPYYIVPQGRVSMTSVSLKFATLKLKADYRSHEREGPRAASFTKGGCWYQGLRTATCRITPYNG
jgi:hypothetical protein